MKLPDTLPAFTRAYIEALYFTEADNGDGITYEKELSPAALERIERDCARFLELAGPLPAPLTRYGAEIQAGHDFWLTRNGHGCGFWEKSDWPEADGVRLTAICVLLGECWAYLGDDGLIYIT